MKQHYNTRLLLLIVSVLFANSVFSQITKTDYFMKSSYMRNSLNPALRPEQGYIVVPVIPTISAGIQTNSINLDNLTFEGPGKRMTFMHKDVSADHFLSKMSKNNYLTADVSARLFALGFYKGDAFWNIDLTTRVHADANLPKSVFQLLKTGFSQNGSTKYDLSNIAATGSAFAEVGVSYSRPIIDGLVVGVRPKFIVGFADFDLNAKSFEIEANSSVWRAQSQVKLRGAAPGVQPTYDEDGMLDGFEFGGFKPTGYGAGLDLGATYELSELNPSLEGFKVSAALNDIGFVSWSKSNAVQLTSPEGGVTIDPNDYGSHIDGETSIEDVLSDAFDDIKKAVNLKQDGGVTEGYTKGLRVNMYIGAEYELLKDELSFGALFSNRFGSYYNMTEYTISANYRPLPWLATAGSYSFKHSKFDTFGFALHIIPSKGVNLFLSSDYVIPHVSSEFLPTTSKGLNMQFGFSIPLGGRKTNSEDF